MTTSQHKNLAILVGGGPAPGINSVISAATIRAQLEGVTVLGIRDGFQWLMQGNIEHVHPLTIDEVSRIHFRGGSHIGIARANPTKDPQLLENAVISLLRLNVSRLITIGGDDTAFSAMKLAEKADGRIAVVHVPKTIDNDLDLPPDVDTFGFQTARHVGVEIVKNLMVDARTTSRWYFVIAMGRKAGHLALGIGKAAGRDAHADPRGVPGAEGPLPGDRRHARRRDPQAAQLRAPRRRGDHRRGARPRARPRGAEGARRGRARRPRAPAHRRREHRRDPEDGRPGGAEEARREGDRHRQEHRLRAALRRPRSRSTSSTRATSATARRSTSSPAARARWSRCRGGTSSPSPSPR